MTAATGLLAAAEQGDLTAGPVALLVVVLIGVALVLLILSMNRRMRRLRQNVDSGQWQGQRGGAPDSAGGDPGAGTPADAQPDPAGQPAAPPDPRPPGSTTS